MFRTNNSTWLSSEDCIWYTCLLQITWSNPMCSRSSCFHNSNNLSLTPGFNSEDLLLAETNIYLLFYWWLGGSNLRMIFCQYVSAAWAVSTLLGGGDTNIHCYNQIHLNFLHSEVVGMLKHCTCTLCPHLVKL